LASIGFHVSTLGLAAAAVSCFFMTQQSAALPVQPGLNPGDWSFDIDDDGDSNKVTTAIEIEGGGFVAGKATDLAITYTIADKWHMYWPGLNDSGPGPIIKFELPDGWSAGEPRWPPPHRRYVQPGNILDHIYERSVTVLIPITAPAKDKQSGSDPGDGPDSKTVSPTIGLSLEWLVCEDVCIAESAEYEIPVVLRAEGEMLPAWTQAKQSRLDALRASVPERIDHTTVSSPVRVVWASDAGEVLNVSVPGARSLTFYPWADGAWPISTLRDGHADGDRLSIRFQPYGPSAPPAPESTDPSYVRALVRADFGAETPTMHVEIKIPRPGVVLPLADESRTTGSAAPSAG
jgi:DsbC/DsbD-like thiol-disulfide interchange protein